MQEMHKGRARPESGGEEQQVQTRTPSWRAQRWFGALVLIPLLVGGALLFLHGCTLPLRLPPSSQPARSATATVTAPTGAVGEPEVVLLPVIEAQPLAAALAAPLPESASAAGALVEPPAPAELAATERPDGVRDATGDAHAPAVGLAGLALAAATGQAAAAHYPTATPTTPADATAEAAALPVSPLPTSDAAPPAAAPETTLSITEALAVALPAPDAATPEAVVEVAVEVAAPAPEALPDYAPDGEARTADVPILMFHYVSTPPADADIYRRDLSVAPDLFAAQLDRLLADGYTTISLYDLMANLGHGAPLPEKPVVLTFDDGYRDLYENALPALRARGMKATVFVLTDFMDEGRPEYLTWDMAREMLAAGISIESHGRNHVSLEGKESDYLIWQALGSEQTIEFELGVRPRFVSYPAGDFDQRVIDVFESANYWAGVTTAQGITHSSADPFRLTRIRVRGTTSPDDLIRLLNAGW